MEETLRTVSQASNLTEIVDADALSSLQERFHAAVGVEICFYDRHGRRITTPCNPDAFCPGSSQAKAGEEDLLGQNLLAAYRAGMSPLKAVCQAGKEHPAWAIKAGDALLGFLVVADPTATGHRDSRRAAAHAGTDGARQPAAVALAESLADLLSKLCYQDHQLRLRIEELSTIYSITGLLAGPFDLQQVLNEIARRVCQVMRVKASSLRLLDEQTGELVIKAVHNLSEEYIRKGPVRVNENPVDAAALSGQTVYIEDVPNDPRTRYPEQARKEGIVSGLSTGMFYRGKPIGVLRVYTDRKHHFSPFEVSLLRAMAAQAAAAIETARLYQEELEAERVRRQLRVASEVQRRSIPDKPPEHPRLQFGCAYYPSYEVGGDFYDFIELSDGRIGVAIADVVGKGIPAALMMASIKSALRVNAFRKWPPEKVISEVNKYMCRDTLVSEFATLFYCVISKSGRRVTYCNAGHDPPLLLRNGEVKELEASGLVIGVKSDERYSQKTMMMSPGDVLLLYTDGVVEAANFEGQRFGRERLRESLTRYGHLEAAQIVRNIMWDLRRFVGLAEQTDDITMVAVKVTAA